MTKYKRVAQKKEPTKEKKKKEKEYHYIQLDDEFRLKCDEWNIQLEQYKEINKQNETNVYEWSWLSYHSNISSALKAYCRKDLRKAKDLDDLINRLDALEDVFNKLIRRFHA